MKKSNEQTNEGTTMMRMTFGDEHKNIRTNDKRAMMNEAQKKRERRDDKSEECVTETLDFFGLFFFRIIFIDGIDAFLGVCSIVFFLDVFINPSLFYRSFPSSFRSLAIDTPVGDLG